MVVMGMAHGFGWMWKKREHEPEPMVWFQLPSVRRESSAVTPLAVAVMPGSLRVAWEASDLAWASAFLFSAAAWYCQCLTLAVVRD